MSTSESVDAPQVPEQPAEAASEAPEIGAPIGYVKGGGTGTAKSEALYEQRQQEAEERRDQADAERALAASQQQVDVPGGPPVKLPGSRDGAVMYTSQMTAHPEVPKSYLLFEYLSRTGVKTGVQCRVDLIVGANPEDPMDLCLVLVCPRCQEHSHKYQQDNQLRIFQSNRFFEFVAGKGDPTFVFEDNMYYSAGMVTHSESFACADCGWRARIENNCVRPD